MHFKIVSQAIDPMLRKSLTLTNKWQRWDSNPWPLAYEASELPDCSTPRHYTYGILYSRMPGLVIIYSGEKYSTAYTATVGVCRLIFTKHSPDLVTVLYSAFR